MALQFASKYKEELEIVEIALTQNPAAVEFVPKLLALSNSSNGAPGSDFVSTTLSRYGKALQFADASVQQSKELVLCAVRNDGTALAFASHALRGDLEVVRAAAEQSELALEWASDEVRAQPVFSVVLQHAIQTHGRMLRFAPGEWLKDPAKIKLAARTDVAAVQLSEVDIADATLVQVMGDHRELHFDFAAGSSSGTVTSAIIDREARTVDFRTLCSVVCPNLTVVRGCRFYYEIEILEKRDEPFTQFGFADHAFSPPEDNNNQGVGDDENSWAVDGCLQAAWHNGDPGEWPEDAVNEVDGSDDESLGSMPEDTPVMSEAEEKAEEDTDKDENEDDKDAVFAVGDRVTGKYCNGMWYKATIGDTSDGGKFVLNWDDGDTKDTIKGPSELKQIFNVGDKVKARYQDGNFCSATIVKKENKAFMLTWADGDTEDRVKTAADLQEVEESNSASDSGSTASFSWGESEDDDDDEDDEDDEDEDEDEDADEESKKSESQAGGGGSFSVGDRVEAKYRNGAWYGGVIEKMEGGKYVLLWDDNDTADRIKSASELRKPGEDKEEEEESDEEDEQPEPLSEWNTWQAGDVIGFFCDPEAGTIAVTVNGQYWHSKKCNDPRLSHEGVSFGGPGLYPALTGDAIKVRYNFGEASPGSGNTPFKFIHPPPPATNMQHWLFRQPDSPAFDLCRGATVTRPAAAAYGSSTVADPVAPPASSQRVVRVESARSFNGDGFDAEVPVGFVGGGLQL